ncbi:hypothetical protein GALL_59920 [mine drainage metagenome]|uniref:Uncharacterized protein n=1 Tax=mine drainage metagenome TaxID=410659 RepID=A0A1J5T7K0_9ZZZZ
MQVKSFLRLITLAIVILFTTPMLAAEDANMHEVYLAAEAGKFNEAQTMMDKVLYDHPNSAKAHYVEAELLAKQGRFSGATDELNTAEQLKPGLPFVKPQALQKLKAQIFSTQSTSNQSYQPSNHNGTPWGMIFLMIGLITFIYFAAKWITQRNQPLVSANNYLSGVNGNTQQYGSPQPYGSATAPMMTPSVGGGIGSGILGGLATGAALGAGMVAGEALMHHFTDGEYNNSGSLFNEAQANNVPDIPNDMGGSDFGIADNSSWDDNSGGDDWS